MVSYGVVADEKAEREFFREVQQHLYREDPSPGAAPRRQPVPPLELFARRGVFIAAISATVDGHLAGLYALTDHLGKAHIDVGYVLYKYRKHGIGYELLDRSFRYLRDCGRRPVFIDIRTVEMVRLVVRLGQNVPRDELIASVSLDPAAKDLKDDLYE